MSRRHERSRGNSINDILRDIDINQVISLMSALGINRNNNRPMNKPNNTGNQGSKDAQEFARLLSNPKFLDIVNKLSRKVKSREMDEESKQREIKSAFNEIQGLMKKNKSEG